MNNVETFTSKEFKESNAFVVYNQTSKNAVLIDTAFGMFDEISKFIEQNKLNLQAIIITHAHFDHFALLDLFVKKYLDISVYITMDEIEGFFNPVLNFSTIYNTKYGTYVCSQPKNLKALMYNKEYEIEDIKFKTIPERGHSKGSVMLDFYEDKILFSGEIIQGDDIKRADIEIADNMKVVEENIRIIFSTMDHGYTIYPSHFKVGFNLGEMIKSNIYVRRILGGK